MMRTRLTRLLSLLAVAAALLLPVGRAWARAGATLVAVVTTDPSAPLTRRVREQLEGLGLDVIVLKPPAEGSLSRAPLEQAARNVGAVAAIRLVPSADSVEVWVADRVTGKAVVRQLVAPAAAGAASDASVALGAVELLRASLMELHSAEPPHGDVPVTEQVRALALPARVEPSPPRLGLSVGGGTALGLGGTVAADGDGALWLGLPRHFGVRAFAALTLSPARITATQAHGAAEVSYQLGGLEASYDFVESARNWVPIVGIGIAGAHVTTVGTADLPFRSATDSGWVAAPVMHGGTAWAFVRGLRLRADVLAAWSPPVHVHLGDQTERWGAPLVKISLGVEVLWAP